ncbi:cell division protein FtsK [Streptosporangiaceae bacterium NEAU-GS5]|nr:cell division protein FtsK [Streptosporangiaceae bacterium NEAU-GS5]
MRIMLTVINRHGTSEAFRDVVVEGDETSTVAGLAAALTGGGRPSNVVRLARARAPYGLDGADGGSVRAPEPETTLWLDGRPLDPDVQLFGMLRDGDRIALDPESAHVTLADEPDGLIELRVVGGPDAGAVHRLALGAHTLGSDPACTVAVRDPNLPPVAATIRLTPSGVTVSPASANGRARHTPVPRGKPARSRYSKTRGSGNGDRPRGDADRQLDDDQRAGFEDAADHLGANGADLQAAHDGHGTSGWADADARSAGPPPGARMTLAGEPVDEGRDWTEGALLTAGRSAFTVGMVEPPDAHLDALPDGGLAYNRPPRLRPPERQRRLEVPVEPKRSDGMRLQLLAALLPALFGIVLARVTGQWYFLLIALMTPLIMIGQWVGDRRHGRKKYRQAAKAYKERLAAFETRLAKARADDEIARRQAAPDPAAVLLTATGPRRRLWERRTHDDDALRLRIGLADLRADLDLEHERGAPAESAPPEPPLARNVPVALAMRRLGVAGLTGPRHVALGCARWVVAQAATLHSPRDLAIVVLSANPDGAEGWDWVRWLPHASPRRVRADSAALVGADPDAAAHRVAELVALITERQEAAPMFGGKLGAGPSGWDDLGKASSQPASGGGEPVFASYDERPYDVLVILDGAQVLRTLPGMPQVLRQGPRTGVYTLAIDDDQRLLPEECATVVSCSPDGSVRLRGGGLDALGVIRGDQVSTSWADRLGRALAPLRDVSREDPASALPDAVRLLDLIELPSGADFQWGRSTKAVIGVGPDGPYSVDLSADGPHALVAGTTGAGKSELLQTLICSLAVVNRPDEMTFVLIDYKGGAAFKECVRLPHTVGMVSDLDGHLTQRALASLAAELRRRERLLLDVGAKDIDDYQRARASTWVLGAGGVTRSDAALPPLPRLVLIIDEFAALVAELPDFVDGLVDVARRGRSLGIHLILATQRPGGVVTADIQANTSLRIALRVTDARESADVIDGPEAALISQSTPGRCVIRSGSGPATAVQAARVGGRTPAPGTGGAIRVTDLPWQALGHPVRSTDAVDTADTDLALLVDRLREAARDIPSQPSPWLPPLADLIELADAVALLPAATPPVREKSHAVSELGSSARSGPRHAAKPVVRGAQPNRDSAGSEWDGEVPPIPFGVTDVPWEQTQRALVLDVRHGGHLLVAGAARSGRSTVLRTLAGSIATHASADDVHIHAIDCGSGSLLPLMALPHCGAVVTRDQLDRVDRLLARLRGEVGRRQQLLAEAGYASLAEARTSGLRLPWLILLLDRWEGYVAAFENYDYGRLLDAFLQLLREGPAVGLRAVVTADRSGLLGQISTVFEDRLILRLADSGDYGLAGLPTKSLPSAIAPGRAMAPAEQGIVESQIALLTPDPAGPAQVAELQALARIAPPPEEHRPLRVDALPTRISADQAMELDPAFDPPSPLWALIGAGGDALAPLGLDLLAQGPAAVIAGPARSGRSSCLLTAARSLLQRGTPVLIVTPRRSPLRDLAGSPGVLAVLDGNARSVAGGSGDDFGGLPGAKDPLALVIGYERYVVIVDDAELLSPESMLGLAVEEMLRGARDGEHGLIIAGTTGDLTTAYRGFTAEARKARTGVLLSVQSPADGDLFNVRLPRGAVGGPPGRGLLIISGTVTPLQAAIPT